MDTPHQSPTGELEEIPAPPKSLAGRLDYLLSLVDRQLLCWGIILMAINTIANVIARLVFSSSLFFSEELNQFLIVLVTFVGISEAARLGRHIRVSILSDFLGPKSAKVLMIFVCIGTAALLFTLCYYSINYIMSLQSVGRLTPSLRVPVYLTYLWIPLGLTITGLQFSLAAYANLTRPGVYLSFHVQDIIHGKDSLFGKGD